MKDIATLASLRYPNYRLLWLGMLFSQTGDWIDLVALNWLVLEMTGSPFYLGLMGLTRAIPMLLFMLVGGVLADRVERRRMLMLTQSMGLVLAFALATPILLGLVNIWQILVISSLRGIMMSMQMPSRQAIISDLVEKKDLTNAIALHAAGFQATGVIGPALAGVLIPVIGVAGCLYIHALTFVAALWALYAMDFPPQARPAPRASVAQNLAEGMAYLRTNPIALSLVALAFVPMFFARPYINMLAVFARDVLAIGPTGLGLLTSLSAVGSVVGALVVASLGDFRRKGSLMLGSLVAFGVLLALFSLSPWPLVSALLVLGVGGLDSAYSSANNTMIQLMVPDQLRGRIMSIFLLNRSMMPLGTALAGSLASLVGAPLAMSAMAGVVALFGLGVAARVPALGAAGEARAVEPAGPAK